MKKILITGATDGIGFETAKLLAKLGHKLIIHGRNPVKLQSTLESLTVINPKTKVESFAADLSNLVEVKKFISDIKDKHQKIDVIINNAGVLKTQNPILDNGFDVRFIVNTISPYLITKELAPLLAEDGRVVNLSSAAQAPVNIKALLGTEQVEEDFQAYAQSKLALTIWSQELKNDFKESQVIVAVNPGSLLASKMVKDGFGVAGSDLSIGADILVRAALSDEFSDKSGKYYDNDSKQFARPHNEAEDATKCSEVLKAIERVIEQLS